MPLVDSGDVNWAQVKCLRRLCHAVPLSDIAVCCSCGLMVAAEGTSIVTSTLGCALSAITEVLVQCGTAVLVFNTFGISAGLIACAPMT